MSREHQPCRRVGRAYPPTRARLVGSLAAEASRVQRHSRRSPLAVARTGQPDGRRRSRHAPALGRRGPDRGVRDPRRPPPLRSARRSMRSSSARRTGTATAGQPRRQPRTPHPRLPAQLHRATRPPATSRPTTTTSASTTDSDGRLLVEALVAHLDADADDAAERDRSEADGDRARRRPGPAAGGVGHEPDRGGRPVRGGSPAVPRRADRARPPAGARCVATGGALRGRVGAARPAPAPPHRHLPGRRSAA